MNKSIGVLKYLAVITLALIVNSMVSPGCSFAANRYNGSEVKSIAIQDGILWCATDEGVLRLDSATGEQRLYTTEDGLPDKSIATVAVSRIGEVWAGSFKGVVQLSGETWTKVVLPANQSLAETMRIVFAPKGNIWVCTPVIQYQYNGLIWLSWALENVQRYSTFFDVDIDSDGTAWFGTMMGVPELS